MVKEVYAKIEQMMEKNQYYTDNDLQLAYEKAMYIYNNIHTYNVNGWLFNNKLLRNGNHKLGNNVLQWDLPAVITCKYKCNHCYALKAERVYKNTRVMRLRNLFLIELAINDVKFYEDLLEYLNQECIWYNQHKGCNVLRLHSAGDIYSNKYLQFIIDLSICLLGIYNVYTYTKQLDNKTIDNINNTYTNFNIVKSFISINDKKYINFGDKEYIQSLSQKLDNNGITYHVCDYGNKSHQSTCMGNCKACLHCDTVLFNQH